MVFGLFTKHCALCGEDVKKENAIKSFGVYVCSEKHAEEYGAKLEETKQKAPKSGGSCCG